MLAARKMALDFTWSHPVFRNVCSTASVKTVVKASVSKLSSVRIVQL